ncbi:MAG: hypothetical protein IJG86_01880 [Clostridia bacterium]|nr:hypothetical protein [Clostridia bacterium]
MKERPILFNTRMVEAILDGRKTQTRRLIKPAPLGLLYEDGSPAINPPVEPGDILWVRETWATTTRRLIEKIPNVGRFWSVEGEGPLRYLYKAGFTLDDAPGVSRWRPSIHMPRSAARIFLRVESVRAGRLQEYFDASCAHAEGIIIDRPHSCQEAVDEFVKLWNSTIKPADLPRYGWEANPWVWVIRFERLEGYK